MNTQDGYSTGTLTAFGIGNDGMLVGSFSNGLARPLGQVALATFINPEGLIAGTYNLFHHTLHKNSGMFIRNVLIGFCGQQSFSRHFVQPFGVLR